MEQLPTGRAGGENSLSYFLLEKDLKPGPVRVPLRADIDFGADLFHAGGTREMREKLTNL
ncbi:MAG: hypothetical protein H6577_27695 [Lewinellaceae bacterium]|nr:hypothetical protein [Saprospiraceae bacterium]MCB9341929.1 hypothetical protein [Lewinellaceae bacterium]